jgi:hypothetical protein
MSCATIQFEDSTSHNYVMSEHCSTKTRNHDDKEKIVYKRFFQSCFRHTMHTAQWVAIAYSGQKSQKIYIFITAILCTKVFSDKIIIFEKFNGNKLFK